MIRHWKIRNLEDRKAYYVPIRESFDETVLDQVVAFMKEHKIKTTQCRIIETSSRFINLPFVEYVMTQLHLQG